MKIFHLVSLSSLILMGACGGSESDIPPVEKSPWQSLTEQEINEASRAVSDSLGPGHIQSH
jgi:hypothetical protein